MYFMMFALWTAVTSLRRFWRAYSKANFTIRRQPSGVIILIVIAASSATFLALSALIALITRWASGVFVSNSTPA